MSTDTIECTDLIQQVLAARTIAAEIACRNVDAELYISTVSGNDITTLLILEEVKAKADAHVEELMKGVQELEENIALGTFIATLAHISDAKNYTHVLADICGVIERNNAAIEADHPHLFGKSTRELIGMLSEARQANDESKVAVPTA